MYFDINGLRNYKMRFSNFHIDRDVLLTADLMNTINGGMSKPVIRMERLEKNYQIRVKVPGVTPGDLVIEIKNNTIFLFHKVTVHTNDLYKGSGFFPFTIGLMMIPFDVNIMGIQAHYEHNELRVIMPFNELSDGYFKRINIDRAD
jgi:HSP20 family molecular chaperone IbpA